MLNIMNLLDLPVEIFDFILDYCEIPDLFRLRLTCRYLCRIISDILNAETKRFYRNLVPIVTNQYKNEIQQRSLCYLLQRERYRVSHNWCIGKYVEKSILHQSIRNMPCLILDKDYLWVSQGRQLKRCKRSRKHLQSYVDVDTRNTDDICRFAKKGDVILAGLRDGNFWLKDEANNNSLFIENGHMSDIHGVSLGQNIFATGSRDRTVKVWPVQFNNKIKPMITWNLLDRIWTLELNDTCKKLAVGTGGNHEQDPFVVYDIESKAIVFNVDYSIKRGAGILGISWESNNTLLTCGYESTLRLWDLRVSGCVQKWEEPHDSTLYCLQTDNLFTVLCGTQNHGKVILWDQRNSKYVQMYFVKTFRRQSSPVFSIAFDPCCLYAAVDRSVSMLDFYGKKNVIRNYGNIYMN